MINNILKLLPFVKINTFVCSNKIDNPMITQLRNEHRNYIMYRTIRNGRLYMAIHIYTAVNEYSIHLDFTQGSVSIYDDLGESGLCHDFAVFDPNVENILYILDNVIDNKIINRYLALKILV